MILLGLSLIQRKHEIGAKISHLCIAGTGLFLSAPSTNPIDLYGHILKYTVYIFGFITGVNINDSSALATSVAGYISVLACPSVCPIL